MNKFIDKNLKDADNGLEVSIKDRYLSTFYAKVNKLITALFMVTDIIDKDEPIRTKLRTLGTEVISDMHSTPANACSKIDQIMSFLDVSFAVNIISEMNCNILQKEFFALNKSIKGNTEKIEGNRKPINLSDF